MIKILVADGIDAEGLGPLATDRNFNLIFIEDQAQLEKELPDADALLVRSKTKVKSDLIERGKKLKFVGRAYKHRHSLALKFLELAEKHPSDPIALDALMQAVWQVNTTPWPVEIVGEDTARAKAFDLIYRDHIRSDKIGPLCRPLRQVLDHIEVADFMPRGAQICGNASQCPLVGVERT